MGLTAGKLEPLSIYRLLRIISERRLSGRLTVSYDRLVKKARIASGVVVHVSSNVKNEGVIYHLVKGGVLTREQGEAISRHRVASGGSSLNAIAAVLGRAEPFIPHVAAVHRLRLLDIFRWTEGRFQFSSDHPSAIRGDIELTIPDVLLHAGAFVATAEQCELFLRRYRHQAVRVSPSDPQIHDLFSRLFKPPNVLQALTRGPVEYTKLLGTLGGGERALRQVFSLVISGLGTFTASQRLPSKLPSPEAPRPQPRATPSAAVRHSATPPPRPTRAPKRPAQAMVRKARKADEAARAALKQAEGLFGQLGQLNHYALMGLERTADTKTVRDRFRTLAREFHLDRFVRLGIDQELRNRVKKVFMEVNRAYHILVNAEKRKAYDLTLQMGAQSGDAAGELVQSAFQAERLVKEGTRLLKNGELEVAFRRFQEALTNGGAEDPVALGGLAYIEAIQSPASRGFEKLKAIVEGRPRREEPYIYLGRLYRNQSDLEQAARCFRMALKVNPGCSEAQSELHHAERRMKAGPRR